MWQLIWDGGYVVIIIIEVILGGELSGRSDLRFHEGLETVDHLEFISDFGVGIFLCSEGVHSLIQQFHELGHVVVVRNQTHLLENLI